MSDITDMMMEGILDWRTGEYLGGSIGHPRTASPRTRKTKYEKNRVPVECPCCGKKVKKIGLSDHIRDVHGDENEVSQ